MFYVGDKIKLKDTLLLDNLVKRDWYNNQPPDMVYTLVHDSKFKKSKIIFALKEDKSKPKWLFTIGDFMLVKRPWYNKIKDYFYNNHTKLN